MDHSAQVNHPKVPGPLNPQNAVNDATMVFGRSASVSFLGWQQRFEFFPLGIGEVTAMGCHSSCALGFRR